MSKEQIDRVYAAKTPAEQEIAYNTWAEEYERDLYAMGYRTPAYVSACFTSFVPMGSAPILDAGCGTGVQSEVLAALGFGPIIGIDISDGMLAVAQSKSIYSELRRQDLGQKLCFPDSFFGAILSSGTITLGHAPPNSFDELLRVLKPSGRIVFSMRCDDGMSPDYEAKLRELTNGNAWKHLFSTQAHQPMPYQHPEILAKVHIYEAV